MYYIKTIWLLCAFQCELYHWADVLDICDEVLEKACARAEGRWTLPCDLPDNAKVRANYTVTLMFAANIAVKCLDGVPQTSGKTTGPRSSSGENSEGPMKTLIVPVFVSDKKIPLGNPSMGILMLKKIRSCKSIEGPVKLGFSMWLPVLRSGKGPKVFPMSGTMIWKT